MGNLTKAEKWRLHLLLQREASPHQHCEYLGCNGEVIARGLCQGHYRQRRLGYDLTKLIPRWSADDVEAMRRHYDAGLPGGLKALARALGRDEGNISRKARQLGLTVKGRKGAQPTLSLFHPPPLPPEERSRRASENVKRRFAEQGHPRGMLGKKHKPEALARMSVASIAKWRDPNSKLHSEENRQRRSDLMVKRVADGSMRAGGYSRGKGGRREDLGGQYFRSRWEANYARFLNLCIKQGTVTRWEFEPKTFSFEAIKRGTRTYTPDFRVWKADDTYEWHEVKGWMDDKSATRLKRMAKYFPEERIVVIGPAFFSTARKSGMAGAIAGWETDGKR